MNGLVSLMAMIVRPQWARDAMWSRGPARGGPRHFEHPHTHWRRGLVDPCSWRSAHAPRGRR